MIENRNTGTDADGLLVKLGFVGSGNANNSFISFLNGEGKVYGKIQSNGGTGVTYATNGIDFAEYFMQDNPSEIIPTGTIVCQGTSGVRLCQAGEPSRIMGVVSAAPAFLGGSEGSGKVIVGLIGQVPVKISPDSRQIAYGDHITVGPDGKGMKAVKPGFMVGKALDNWLPGGPDMIQVFITANTWANPGGVLAIDLYTLTADLAYDVASISATLLASLEDTIATTSATVKDFKASPDVITGQLVSMSMYDTVEPATNQTRTRFLLVSSHQLVKKKRQLQPQS